METKSTWIQVRVPPDLREAMLALMEARSKRYQYTTMSDVIRDALAEYIRREQERETTHV